MKIIDIIFSFTFEYSLEALQNKNQKIFFVYWMISNKGNPNHNKFSRHL